MNLSIKQLTANPALSAETLCFSCTVHVDGKKAFVAMNHGTGGSNDYIPVKGQTYEAIRKAEAWARRENPDEYDPLDFVIGNLIEREAARKELARLFKAKLVFLKGGDLMSVASVVGKSDEAASRRLVTKQVPGVVFLNDLPVEEAIDRYLEVDNGQ